MRRALLFVWIVLPLVLGCLSASRKSFPDAGVPDPGTDAPLADEGMATDLPGPDEPDPGRPDLVEPDPGPDPVQDPGSPDLVEPEPDASQPDPEPDVADTAVPEEAGLSDVPDDAVPESEPDVPADPEPDGAEVEPDPGLGDAEEETCGACVDTEADPCTCADVAEEAVEDVPLPDLHLPDVPLPDVPVADVPVPPCTGPLDCQDSDPCTQDLCDPTLGCLHSPVSCDDDIECTVDACDAVSGCSHTPDNSRCDDEIPCTTGVCSASKGCVFTTDDSKCDDQDPCTRDTCFAVNGCESVTDSSICDDHDPCTVDFCTQGTGCGYTPKACADDHDCTIDTCDSREGSCVHEPVDSACVDGNTCTDDTCDPGTGCTHTPNTAPCDDGDPCTVGDACDGGGCVAGAGSLCEPSSDPCKYVVCEWNPALGHVCKPLPVAKGLGTCDDSDVCTSPDYCDGDGACTGDPVPGCCRQDADCDDGKPCTKDSCVVTSGRCIHPDQGSDTPCDADGDGCTAGDHCLAGACVAGPAVSCVNTQPADSCEVDACTSTGPDSHVCDPVPAPKGTPCDDGQFCTVDDACDADGFCDGAANPCTGLTLATCEAAACDETGNACAKKARPNGSACSTGNACLTDEACTSGTCGGGASLCAEERVDVAGKGGSRVPGAVHLGSGRWAAQWTMDATDGNRLRVTDGSGSRLDEEVPLYGHYHPASVEDAWAIWLLRPAASPDGRLLAQDFVGPNGCYGAQWTECNQVQGIKGRLFGPEGAQIKESSLASYNVHRIKITDQGYAWTDIVHTILLGYSDGKYAMVDAVRYAASAGIKLSNGDPDWAAGSSPEPDVIRLTPIGSDLIAGTPVPLVWNSDGIDKALLGANRFDATVQKGTTENLVVAWVGAGSTGQFEAWALRFDRAGNRLEPAPFKVVGYFPDKAVGSIVIRGTPGGGLVVGWDRTREDDSNLTDYGTFVTTFKPGTLAGQTAAKIRVNEILAGDQRIGDIGVFSDGSFVVAYDDAYGDGSDKCVKVHRFHANGTSAGDSFVVNTQVTGHQHYPAVVVLDNDEFLVVFRDYANRIWSRRFSHEGEPLPGRPELRANAAKAGAQTRPSAAASGGGTVLFAYESGTSAVLGRVFDTSAREVKAEFPLAGTSTGARRAPAAGAWQKGFVATWQYTADGFERIDGARYDTSGTLLSSFTASATAGANQQAPSLAVGKTGAFAVVWEASLDGADGPSDVMGRTFGPDATAKTAPFAIPATTAGRQAAPHVVPIPLSSDFLAAWETPDTTGTRTELALRRFDASGTPKTGEVRLVSSAAMSRPRLAVSPDGGAAVVCFATIDVDTSAGATCRWVVPDSLAETGTPFRPSAISAGVQQDPFPAWMSTDTLLVTYATQGLDADGLAVQVRAFTPDGTPRDPRVQLNRNTTADQTRPLLVPLDALTYLAGWETADTSDRGIAYRILPAP